MTSLIFGKDKQLLRWAASMIPNVAEPENFGPAAAVGVATGLSASDKLMAVVVYHDYMAKYRTCQVSIASADPRWVSRGSIRDLLAVPFVQYRCNLIWSAVPHTSERVIKFAESIGFLKEAVLRDRFGPGTHACILRMRSQDYDDMYVAKNKKAFRHKHRTRTKTIPVSTLSREKQGGKINTKAAASA